MDDFENFIDSLDNDYNSEDVTFTGFVYKINTPQFNVVKRSVHAKNTGYMQEIVEHRGQNYYVPKNDHCFLKYKN